MPPSCRIRPARRGLLCVPGESLGFTLDGLTHPWLDDGMETTTNLSPAQARQIARWLSDNGATGVQIVECFPGCQRFVKFYNRCNMSRVINTTAEFVAYRESVAS